MIGVWSIFVDSPEGVKLCGSDMEFAGGDRAAVDIAAGECAGLDEGVSVLCKCQFEQKGMQEEVVDSVLGHGILKNINQANI